MHTLKLPTPNRIGNYKTQIKNKAKKIPTSINDLFEHFNGLNEHNNTINDNIPSDNSIIFQPELDYDFTDEEMRHIAKQHLKKNKATGDDNILNEYIYSTIDLFIPVYKTLFNYILHTGNAPHDWVIGNIFLYIIIIKETLLH